LHKIGFGFRASSLWFRVSMPGSIREVTAQFISAQTEARQPKPEAFFSYDNPLNEMASK